MTAQITFRELVQDPLYRKWFLAKPQHADRRWVAWVQREEGGRWARREFDGWREGARWVVAHHERVWDLSLCCPGRATPRPKIKTKRRTKKGLAVRVPWPLPEGHRWCPYCRRPTVFRRFSKHHAMWTMSFVNPNVRRCTACGVKEDFLPQRGRG